MSLIDYVFYIAGIIAVSCVCFRAGQRVASAIFKKTKVRINYVGPDGVKTSKTIWLNPDIAEDKEFLAILDECCLNTKGKKQKC